MRLKVILGIACLSLSSTVFASIQPKYDFEEITSDISAKTNYEADIPLTLESDKFQLPTLLNANNFSQGNKRLVSFTSGTISLLDILDGDAIKIKEEFTTSEIGLHNTEIEEAKLSSDDNSLYLLVYTREPETGSRKINLHRYNIKESGLELAQTLENVISGYWYHGAQLHLSSDSSQLIVLGENNQSMAVFSVNAENGELNLSHSGDRATDYSVINASINAEHQILAIVYSNYYASDRNCVEAYQLKEDGTIGLVDSITCNNSEISSQISTAQYNAKTGHLLILGYSGLTIIEIDESGNLTPLVNTTKNAAFNNLSSSFITLKEHTLSFTSSGYPRTFEVFSYDDNGNFSHKSSTDINALTGSYSFRFVKGLDSDKFLVRLSYDRDYGIITLNNDYTLNYAGTTSIEEEHITKKLGNYFVPVDENMFFTAHSNSLNLISTSQSKKFELVDAITLENNTYYYGYSSHFKLDDSTYLVIEPHRYLVVNYDQTTRKLTVLTEEQYTTSNDETLSILSANNKLVLTWIDNKYLIAKTNYDRLAVFELVDSTLIFKEYLVDLVAGYEGISDTVDFISLEDEIFLLQNNSDHLYQLSINDGEITPAAEPTHIHGLGSNGKVVKVGNKQLYIQGDNVFAFELNDGQLELLTISPLARSPSSTINLDERHILFSYDTYFDVYKFNQEKGALTFADRISFSDTKLPVSRINFQNASFDGKKIWYQSNYSWSLIGNIDLNRAPVWTNDNVHSITLNEGQQQSHELADFIEDLDGDIVNFTELELPPSLSIGEEKFSIEFDGSIETFDQATINASDSVLESKFTFDLNYNFAPTLKDPTNTIAVNENALITLDISTLYDDVEGDYFVLSLGSEATLEVLSNGTLVGNFSNHGEIGLEVTATDERGANKTETVNFIVNGAPKISGSSSITVTVDEQVNIDLNSLFIDPENNPATFLAQGLPSGLSLSTGSLSGKISDSGSHSFVITATDSEGAESHASFKITVSSKSGGGGGSLNFLLSFLLLMVGVRYLKR
ncbi:putative Ig domain-containing protein [Aliikangiella coralliicola]|uniref:Dystroglycan-type cadherin-like domain-containing protein n=1 Tax=Aliikangiella coralliicola TaxID=2592383 RepID=A0A545UIH0_9GAMM|nr:putative Ig domain-containing protein [Aliikangiella coralliicola]TQV89258.1 hypothetical protein FLL46_03770 [Aliikangiella coralliicola]